MMTTDMQIGKIPLRTLREMLNSGEINEICFRMAVKYREEKMLRVARRTK